MATLEQHFPVGAPRGRLRSHPMLCPERGRLVVGEVCLRCEFAAEVCGFIDCALVNEQADLAAGGGKSCREALPAAAIVAEAGAADKGEIAA